MQSHRSTIYTRNHQMVRTLALCRVFTMAARTRHEHGNDRNEARFRFTMSFLVKIALSQTVNGADNTSFWENRYSTGTGYLRRQVS